MNDPVASWLASLGVDAQAAVEALALALVVTLFWAAVLSLWREPRT